MADRTPAFSSILRRPRVIPNVPFPPKGFPRPYSFLLEKAARKSRSPLSGDSPMLSLLSCILVLTRSGAVISAGPDGNRNRDPKWTTCSPLTRKPFAKD